MEFNAREFIVLFVLVSISSADFWSNTITTNSSSWSIYRQSQNLSFDLSSSVEGNISAIESYGRVLSPHQSYYADVTANDIRLRERISALEGKYKYQDKMKLLSRIDNDIYIYFNKPSGTNIYTFSFYERWPVLLTSSKTLEYQGRQINSRDFEANNRDFVGSNLLYNRNLSEERQTVMWLDRMNATVLATDDAILQAEFMPTKYLGYLILANTTGIADLRYKQAQSGYDVKRRDYPAASEGYERYYGTYTIGRKIEMRSIFDNNILSEEWLPCCYDRWFIVLRQN